MHFSDLCDCNIPDSYGYASSKILSYHLIVEGNLQQIVSEMEGFDKGLLKSLDIKFNKNQTVAALKRNLSFSGKLKVVESILNEENQWIIRAFENLNKLRNLIAHNRFHSDRSQIELITSYCEDIISTVSKNTTADIPPSLRGNKLRFSVVVAIDQMKVSFKHINWKKEPILLNGFQLGDYPKDSLEGRMIEIFGEGIKELFPVVRPIQPQDVVD
ncbi:hypothetical protein D5E87_25640 [Vibrio parahaemolyticus]|uniref:hypothetical protein n=1 Tax=Vibrio parahaemolyticus TaxID=670 RepID=UPI00103737E6|nr:hypothetical protein [Vibrio parahaemolyticus]ELA8097283.1 hypothetical protein [Vibrio parahaemolyticus]TBT01249.1 hypothetical protein D5E87_25640 [Vibrio parahaemolyticus]TOQ87539.1 hypothetical protein CGG85_22595 [Vibrio parahaemolyticus]WMN90479.1 hypothetical protein NI381_08735 [Vibrio parahaemolyticus]WMO08137.1 hypothetical protein NI377_08745 [Vibrio parahaemolyticus]